MNNSGFDKLIKIRGGRIFSPSSFIKRKEIRKLNTGLDYLDEMLGEGIPSCIIEVFGWEGVGKTSFCIEFANALIKKGMICLFADFDKTLDFTNKLLHKTEEFLLVKPENLEMIIKIIETLPLDVFEGMVLVIDSITNIFYESLTFQEIKFRLADLILKVKTLLRDKFLFILLVNQNRMTIKNEIAFAEPILNSLIFTIADISIEIIKKQEYKNGFDCEFRIRKNIFLSPITKELKFVFNKGFKG